MTLLKQTGHTRLYRRGAYYYHRAMVPTDIKEAYKLAYGKAEETSSLKTTSRAEALRLVKIEAVRVDQKFDEVRNRVRLSAMMSVEALITEQVERIKGSPITIPVGEDEMISGGGYDELDDAGNVVGKPSDVPRVSFEELEEKVARLEIQSRQFLTHGRYAIGSCRAEPKEQLTASQSIHEQNQQGVAEVSEADVQVETTTVTLAHVYQDWRKEQELARVTRKTIEDHDNWKTLFVECCGDLPISQYTKEHGRNFKSILMCLPSNRAKIKGIAGLPLPVMIDEARKKNLSTLGVTSVNKGLSRMATFFGWAVKHDYLGVNPVKDIKLDDKREAPELALNIFPASAHYYGAGKMPSNRSFSTALAFTSSE